MKPKMYIASCSFGKDSIATILLALEKGEPLDRVVFAEVMFDHTRNISGEIPEHIQWIYGTAIPKLEAMGVKVDVVRAEKDYVTLSKQKRIKGAKVGQMYGVQNSFPCFANSELKIKPIKDYIKNLKGKYEIIQYVGIASDEPKRLARLEGTNKVSLLAKYKYSEAHARYKCRIYDLLSPIYEYGCRGGCWFCYNAEYARYINIRRNYPEYWQAFRDLYNDSDSKSFCYGKTLQKVEEIMDKYEMNNKKQLKLFD